jgi:hypothetical protein
VAMFALGNYPHPDILLSSTVNMICLNKRSTDTNRMY